MSETYPESPPRSSVGSGILTRKIGPLPVWAWMGIGLVAALGWYLIQKKKTPASATAQSTTSGTTNSSLIPQFVNQVYTSGSPPAAHNMHGTPKETTPPNSTTPANTSTSSSPYIIAVPNGSGGWMEAVFPSQTAVNNFYSGVGVTNGDYPTGLNNSQLTAAVTKAGGNVASFVANSGPSGLVQ
jgi:hypothetical protein